MTSIIEFNDLEISLYHGSERLYQQPGYAIVREGDMLFGNAARRLARVHPQQANQQYFARMNAVYEKSFATSKPARACVQVAALPKGAKVEIDVIAAANG